MPGHESTAKSPILSPTLAFHISLLKPIRLPPASSGTISVSPNSAAAQKAPPPCVSNSLKRLPFSLQPSKCHAPICTECPASIQASDCQRAGALLPACCLALFPTLDCIAQAEAGGEASGDAVT